MHRPLEVQRGRPLTCVLLTHRQHVAVVAETILRRLEVPIRVPVEELLKLLLLLQRWERQHQRRAPPKKRSSRRMCRSRSLSQLLHAQRLRTEVRAYHRRHRRREARLAPLLIPTSRPNQPRLGAPAPPVLEAVAPVPHERFSLVLSISLKCDVKLPLMLTPPQYRSSSKLMRTRPAHCAAHLAEALRQRSALRSQLRRRRRLHPLLLLLHAVDPQHRSRSMERGTLRRPRPRPQRGAGQTSSTRKAIHPYGQSDRIR